MTDTETVPSTILRAPFAAQTWRAFAYLLVSAVLGAAGAAYIFFGFGAGIFLTLTVIGIPLIVALVLAGRIWGNVHRKLGAVLLNVHVPSPPPFRPREGLMGWLTGGLTDLAGWRGIAYVLVTSVLNLVGGYFALVFAAMSIFTAISPIPWVLFNPENVAADGTRHHSLMQFGDFFIDTWPRVLALSAVGIVACFLAPWPIRGLAALDGLLIRALLGPTAGDVRVRELEQRRSVAVEDSAATLRRVERDLHDGTQARLVTMAMALGRAEERIASGQDASTLVSDAHASAKDALEELRELVRGIHPPALDLGLPDALRTLAARSTVPVDLHVELPVRPTPGIEAIAYFSVAELLTNVAKHAQASAAEVRVVTSGADLSIVVRDDGLGGADPRLGSGVAGLAARAESVDGSMCVNSPEGGPTVVSIELPMAGTR